MFKIRSNICFRNRLYHSHEVYVFTNGKVLLADKDSIRPSFGCQRDTSRKRKVNVLKMKISRKNERWLTDQLKKRQKKINLKAKRG